MTPLFHNEPKGSAVRASAALCSPERAAPLRPGQRERRQDPRGQAINTDKGVQGAQALQSQFVHFSRTGVFVNTKNPRQTLLTEVLALAETRWYLGEGPVRRAGELHPGHTALSSGQAVPRSALGRGLGLGCPDSSTAGFWLCRQQENPSSQVPRERMEPVSEGNDVVVASRLQTLPRGCHRRRRDLESRRGLRNDQHHAGTFKPSRC